MDLPDDVTPDQLDREVRADLRGLSRDTADTVARHLVMTGRLIDSDPEAALTHARAASALGGRVAAVREAAGLAAYAAGEWQEALSELRTFRRISGDPGHLPVLADCERALGRPERALAVGDDPAVSTLDQTVRVELVLVLAGARRDLGQKDAAVLLLQGPARATSPRHPWAARLWYGYADALLDAGRPEEAEQWFSRVLEVDGGETDADERLLELQGVQLSDDDEATGTEDTRESDAEAEPAPGLSSEELSAMVEGVQPLSARPAATRVSEARVSEARVSGARAAGAGAGAAASDPTRAADGAPGPADGAAEPAASAVAPGEAPASARPTGRAQEQAGEGDEAVRPTTPTVPAAAFAAPPAAKDEQDDAEDATASGTADPARPASRPVPVVTFVQPQDTPER